jgi:hypothetical protein
MRSNSIAALLLASMLLTCGAMWAQSASSSSVSDQDLQLLRKDLRSQRKQIVAANMGLTDAEAVKFWPIYDQYVAELAKINDTRIGLIKEYADNYGDLSDAKAQSIAERWLVADEAAVKLRSKYVPLVQAVLPGRKVALFFQVDRRIGVLTDLQAASAIPLVEP